MNIYVGNVAPNVTEEDLQGMFAVYGKTKSVKLIKDMFTGKSKGFAFVEMYSENEGQKAIDELNLAEVEGKKIMVNQARPKTDKRGGRSGGGSRRGR
ncbi:MAG: RNA-binding protein [Bacteroidetes bacterium]|nr:RNA-binding protein [Bacteroidota bacterium]MBU1677238.1 RNA-binding protein [Bacteroidota bacterium]MBU2506864.1 RNA-binding protein [Bacteroidota bacterium]